MIGINTGSDRNWLEYYQNSITLCNHH